MTKKHIKTAEKRPVPGRAAATAVPSRAHAQSGGRATEAPPPSPLIVGIGASAGGLAAFKGFFGDMPADTGMTFVLVQHLDPTHQSMLVELLAPHVAMPVAEAQDGMKMAENHVYVIPPNSTLTFEDGHLRVSKPAPARAYRRPIDTFFVSLAENHDECAVGIVLSGVGSDGSLGLGTIKERGGLTLAQAEFDSSPMSGMPHSAVATGLVDIVVPVEGMPAKLIEYQHHLNDVSERKDADGTRQDASRHLAAITTALRERINHDFSGYKEKTLIRRVQRRMQILQIESFPAYAEFLRQEPQEGETLFGELLIGVTEFFRDPDAFEALKANVIASLLAAKGGSDPIRIWVPGCATGEEVYSIAILLKEAMGLHRDNPQAVIFGTDLDANAVAFARAGRYRKMEGLSPERLDRWFAKEGEDYCPIPAIRDMCVFSVHSLVKDPPFSKLDLISCRNVLIYLGDEFQNRVMQMFHYALVSGGYLFLGPSESAGRGDRLFSVLDKKHRILQRLDGRQTALPAFHSGSDKRGGGMPPLGRAVPTEDFVAKSASRLMEKYAPAYFVIDRNHEILRFSGGETSLYLEPSSGPASLNLFAVLRKDLRPEVRASLQEAIKAQKTIVKDELTIRIDGQDRDVVLIVEPIVESARDSKLYVIAFRERDRPPAKSAGARSAGTKSTGKQAAAKTREPKGEALQREARALRSQLQAARDEMESYIEENKSATEEYQSVNEELQSSNEELETAKEEMQSVNEELQTINSELNNKNELLLQSNSDLQNLLDSTQIATVFLDDELRIRNFTPSTTDLFPLRHSDRGRTITDFVSNLKYDELRQDVRDVQRKLSIVEREVTLKDGAATYIMRIRPYRTVQNVIDGVVMTFSDITERKRAEQHSRSLRQIVESSADAIIGKDLNGTISSWNSGAERLFGYRATEAVGGPISMIIPPDRQDEETMILDRIGRGESIDHFDTVRLRKDGRLVDISLTISPILDSEGKVIGASKIARDVTERKQTEQALRESEARLQFTVDSARVGPWDLELATGKARTSFHHDQCFGATEPILDWSYEKFLTYVHPDDRAEVDREFREAATGQVDWHFECRVIWSDGSVHWISAHGSVYRALEGKPTHMLGIVADITERKRQADHVDFLMREMSHRSNNLLSVVQSMAYQTTHSSDGYQDFAKRFHQRLQGLAYSNRLLVQQDWKGAPLDELANMQLQPFVEADTGRLETDGAAIMLNVEAAQAIGLALHELATNAAKHGALSPVSEGKVRIHWELFDGKSEPCFRLVWQESGGPPVKPPGRKGFGSVVLEKMTKATLAGETEAEFAPGGLRWELTCPASRVLQTGAAGAA